MGRIVFTMVTVILLTVGVSVAYAAPLKVAATIFPLADIVRQVGGDRVTVTTIIPAGASEHIYEPTSSQMRQVADVVLYVKVGAGMDDWVDRLVRSARKPPMPVSVTSGVRLLRTAEQELLGQEEEEHHHSGDDPHIWLDPILVRDSIVPRITEALIKLSPADSSRFRDNAKRFQQELTRLDQEMRQGVAGLKRHEFIAMHSAWAYMAKRYGLRQVAAVETFPGKEPSARYLVELVKLARKQGVSTIFAEPQLSNKAAQVIAREVKGTVLLLDPVGGENIAGRNSYLALMRYNLSQIVRGMGK
ncbi:MAG: zinc ABC transporter substrate-binding protein [Geobacter sp.]|nr:zinc ABC transporter substrate-binding protein [Geobacter sp.]